MELIPYSTQKVMIAILRHVAGAPTISILQETLKMTHVGVWKALKKLESAGMIILESSGNKKNSVFTTHLNWQNPLVEKTISLALEHEATSHRRWLINFSELKKVTDFVILYGSILHSPKEANDIDLISVVSKKSTFMEIGDIIMKIQKIQLKPIHNIPFSQAGLKDEIKRKNIAFINAFKYGVILFGQDKFVEFIRRMGQ